MVDYVGDPFAFSHLVGLSEALTRELEARFLPPVCFQGVVPGDTVAIDFVEDGCGGIAWVRLTSMFPSLNFPVADVTPTRVLQMAYGIELAVFRPYPVPDNAEPVSEEEQFEATRLQTADMTAMLQVLCAYPDANDLPIAIGTYTPLGPQGASIGGTWTATLGVR